MFDCCVDNCISYRSGEDPVFIDHQSRFPFLVQSQSPPWFLAGPLLDRHLHLLPISSGPTVSWICYTVKICSSAMRYELWSYSGPWGAVCERISGTTIDAARVPGCSSKLCLRLAVDWPRSRLCNILGWGSILIVNSNSTQMIDSTHPFFPT